MSDLWNPGNEPRGPLRAKLLEPPSGRSGEQGLHATTSLAANSGGVGNESLGYPDEAESEV